MESRARLEGVSMTLTGDILVSFSLLSSGKATLESLDALKGAELDLTAVKHREKRSLDSNRYCWKLCDLIAKKIQSDKDSIYKMELERYGVFEDISIRSDAVERFCRDNKYTDVRYQGDGWTVVRVYYGSHCYDSKEMSELITGVCADAEELGIEVLPPDELARMNALWKGASNG